MAAIDLTKYGITGTVEIVHNPSYELLFEEETKPGLEGYEKGQVSELGSSERNDRYLYGTFPQRQIHRYGREFQGHRVVDLR